MFWIDIVAALLLALLMTLIFGMGLGRRGPWSSMLAFFVVLFLAIWAGGMWITPAGPVLWGFYWLPYILIAFVVGLILASAAGGPRERRPKIETAHQVREKEEARREVKLVFDAFFWGLVILFSAIIIFGYVLGVPV